MKSVVPIRHVPFNAEAPIEALRAPVTPTENVYVRTNFGVLHLDAAAHGILVHGAVLEPRQFSIDELRAMPHESRVVTIECAGNDRMGMRPLPGGEPWASGALSTVEWRGVPLARVLDHVGVERDAIQVLVEGADRGPRTDAEDPSTDVPFARALSLADVRRTGALLATEMNGVPLLPEHGAPVRLLVPGWYAMASVKWVARIELLRTPFDGYFQTRRYVYLGDERAEPVTRMRVKSIITDPVDGSTLSHGRITVRGWAWSGDGAITRVDVALGGGSEWQPATLAPPADTSAWTGWEITFADVPRGRHSLRSRATDAAGNTQPDVAEWNVLGYGNNAVRPVVIEAS